MMATGMEGKMVRKRGRRWGEQREREREREPRVCNDGLVRAGLLHTRKISREKQRRE